MSSNPFGNSSGTTVVATELQTKTREKVKVTVYGVLGALVILCLALLFQGCQSRRSTAELPPAEALSGNHPEVTPTSTIPSSETAQQTAPVKTEVQPETPAPVSAPAPVAVNAPAPVPESAPAIAPTTVPSTDEVYTIKKGDTLSRIAKSHGVTLAALKQANSLSNDRILVGKKLKIPARS